MKKQSLLLITGGLLALASCNNNTAGNEDAQAKIDSMVNERVEQIRMELEMKNDSIINELAMYRADSIMAAMKGKTVSRPKPKPKAPVKTTTDVAETTSGGSSSKGGGMDGIKSKSDANKESGADRLKSKADGNQKSGSSKFKDKAD